MASFTSTTTSTDTMAIWTRFSRRAIRIRGECRPQSQLPAAYTSDVDVHEVGSSIVTHPSAMQAQRGIPDGRCRNSGQANIDRFRLHVKTVASHARIGAAGAEEFVAPGRAVSTDHVDLATGIVERRGQVVEQVKQA